MDMEIGIEISDGKVIVPAMEVTSGEELIAINTALTDAVKKMLLMRELKRNAEHEHLRKIAVKQKVEADFVRKMSAIGYKVEIVDD